MRDPYEVLEIKRGASKDEIKAAYRRLAKKYHPDMHTNNPLKDLAQEKFIEVQQAYDQLMDNNSSSNTYTYGNSTSSDYSSYNSSSNSSNSSYECQSARQYINAGNYRQAINILNKCKVRSAEWNFLMGVCYVNLGSNIQGLQYVKTANRMEPSNVEYINYLNQINNMQRAYQNRSYNYNRGGRSDCDCCMNLLCADCLCECLGGDLISCC